MKTWIIYGLILILAFVGVTTLMLYMNEKYVSIFQFDFTEKSVPLDSTAMKADSLKQDSLKNLALKDSLANATVKVDSLNADGALDSLASAGTETIVQNQPTVPNPAMEEEALKSDTTYQRWKKDTLKLYETMRSEQVAKVITKFSDSVARDLIYSMKKKKAAEVLALLDPETVARLTRVQKSK